MISTVIIDSHQQNRKKISALLSLQKDFDVLAQGKDAYDALKFTGSLKPDIAILGTQLEYIEGEEIPPLLRARSPSTAVVIMTEKISDFQLYRAVSSEVSGLIQHETDIGFLPAILKCILMGGCFISPFLTGRVLRLLSPVNRNTVGAYLMIGRKAPIKGEKERFFPDEDPTRYLTKTELQILTCVGQGNSSQEIAKSLKLAAGTVRNYVSSVMQKTGSRNRAQMVHFALKHSLVPFV